MITHSLNGLWKLEDKSREYRVSASIPCSNLSALLEAGEIPDPLVRDNEKQIIPLAERTWIFSRTFEVKEDLLAEENILLRCKCLDTFASVRVNGHLVGSSYNFHRQWEFPVKKVLKKGRNTLEITIDSPLHYHEPMEKEHGPLFVWKQFGSIGNISWVRKPAYHLGWDWGPALAPCGIPRDIELVGWTMARIADVAIRQHHKKNLCDLNILIDLLGRPHDLKASVAVIFEGKIVAEENVTIHSPTTSVKLRINKPELWWPNGLGKQPLYQVNVLLFAQNDQPLDLWSRRTGLRVIELRQRKDKWGRSFEFVANGVPFFSKGSNVIPMDVIQDRKDSDDYRKLLTDAAECHTNMIRVWGGSFYHENWFYDICDELGICVWHDMMFACSTYPTFDFEFMANVAAETEENVNRLRHHASIVLWCGNNELEQGLYGDGFTEKHRSWDDYKPLWDELIPNILSTIDPQRPYWPGSPHKSEGDRNKFLGESSGDAHLWDVWHGRKPFEWYRTCHHRFNSEFGFQCFNEPKTLDTFTKADERNITHPIMEYHQRSAQGNALILDYALSWFRMAESSEMILWLSQILQGLALKYAIEHWRRLMPRGMGTIYWQLNDVWGGATWATIDHLGRWKAGQYMSKKFFAPTLLSALENPEKKHIDIYITSDEREASSGHWSWRLTLPDGKIIKQGKGIAKIAPLHNQKVGSLDFAKEAEKYGSENLLLFIDLNIGGKTVSNNFATFTRPKAIELQDPKLQFTIKPSGKGKWTAQITAKRPALWTWLEARTIETRFSDNFIHLEANTPSSITIETDPKVGLAQLRKELRVRSLFDTYQPAK